MLFDYINICRRKGNYHKTLATNMYTLVIQYYEACGKNEGKALECLISEKACEN